MTMIKCPACDLECDEEDLEGQKAHMMAKHPGIVAQRLAEPLKNIQHYLDAQKHE